MIPDDRKDVKIDCAYPFAMNHVNTSRKQISENLRDGKQTSETGSKYTTTEPTITNIAL